MTQLNMKMFAVWIVIVATVIAVVMLHDRGGATDKGHESVTSTPTDSSTSDISPGNEIWDLQDIPATLPDCQPDVISICVHEENNHLFVMDTNGEYYPGPECDYTKEQLYCLYDRKVDGWPWDDEPNRWVWVTPQSD